MNDTSIKKFESQDIPKISRDPLDEVQVGDFYWIEYEETEKDDEGNYTKNIKKIEELMCVNKIGSNYVGFTKPLKHGNSSDRIHFDQFFARCHRENNWKDVLQKQMDSIQKQIKEKTQELIDEGKKLYLIPDNTRKQESNEEMLPMRITQAPEKYKKDLVKMQKDMPKISKELEELAEDYAVTAKQIALPDLVRLECVKESLEIVKDRIFTIELYCGLQEKVYQIQAGEPADTNEKIAIRQQLLFMDEETLFDYECGGMNFENVDKFDAWVIKPENLNRILPEKKGVVAFRIRRKDKDYGEARCLSDAWNQFNWKCADKQTYLLIRNGENVYRIWSELDFSPRLIPKRDEIGEEQYKKRDKWFEEKEELEELINQDSVEFDDCTKKLQELLKKYNRVVIMIQGLLDRSKVFSPHPIINLAHPGKLDEWVNLIRDEEDGLPMNKITWEAYRDQLNKSLRVGKYVYISLPSVDKYREYYDEEKKMKRKRPRHGWVSNVMPKILRVDAIKKDGSEVKVSWPAGKCLGKWVDNPNKPGYMMWNIKTERLLHEWVPTHYCLNVTDYVLGDYKMFLCDRSLQGQYLKWARYLLSAEDWQRNRKNGVKIEEDELALTRDRI